MDLPTKPKGFLAFAWYRREDYPRIREMMEDGHLLPTSYDKWLKGAEKGFQSMKDRGFITIKAEIEPGAFLDWCKGKGLHLNADARNRWGLFVAEETARKSGLHPRFTEDEATGRGRGQ